MAFPRTQATEDILFNVPLLQSLGLGQPQNEDAPDKYGQQENAVVFSRQSRSTRGPHSFAP